VTLHYDTSPYIHLDEWITVFHLSIPNEDPTTDDIQTYIIIANEAQHTQTEWNSYLNNTVVPSDQVHLDERIATVQGKPIDQQDTPTPFIGSFVVTWDIID
jgi:hypothetical protein